jgi:hypothetical protein
LEENPLTLIEKHVLGSGLPEFFASIIISFKAVTSTITSIFAWPTAAPDLLSVVLALVCIPLIAFLVKGNGRIAETMRASVFRRASQEPASPSPARRARSTERSVDNVFRLDREASSGEFQDDDLAVEEHDIDSERLASAHMTEEGGDGADKRKTHRRAMSDPFDTADSGGATDNESRTRAFSHADSFDTTTEALPTLPRFPHAESRDKNCWSEPSVSIFHVRGQRYLEDKKKIPSGPYLLPARGVDLFVTGSPHEYQLGE